MAKLPNFCILENSNEWGRVLVLDLRTLLVGCPYCVDYREMDEIDQKLEDLANGRYPVAKVPGHTIFVTPKFRLSSERLTEEEVMDSLRGMAQFFHDYAIGKSRAKYARNRDGYVPELDGSFRPLTPEQLAEKKARKAAERAEREAAKGHE